MDITEQILNPQKQWDDYHSSPNEFFSRVDDDVISDLLEQESLSSCWQNNEKNALYWCSRTAKFGQFGYVVSGIWLNKIRLWKHLWQRKAKSFHLFCQQLIGKGSWYASRLIKAAKVCLALIKQGFKVLPTCEAQARPLTKYLTENDPILGDVCCEEMFDKWQEVIDTLPSDKTLTANHVETIVNGEERTTKSVITDAKTYDRLQRLADDAGMSKQEYINYLLDKEEAPETEESAESEPETKEVEPAKNQRWKSDLRDLVAEYESNNYSCNYSVETTALDIFSASG